MSNIYKKGYRIDERVFNGTYHNMKLGDCPVLKK